MSAYRFFQSAYVANQYFPAGTVAATADVGGLFPTGWVPGPYVDPLDTAAVNALYAAGPQLLLTFQFGTLSFQVRPPATYWKATAIPGSPAMSYSLTGLGIGLSPICT
jgi:hypothetical protein